MVTRTGPGRHEPRSNPAGWLLYNFDIEGHQLKEEHRRFLQQVVAPVIRSGKGVSIVGLASRTGTFAYNQRLSQQRAYAVVAFLRGIIPTGFQAREVTAFGERKAQREGYPDEIEDHRFRSVMILLGSGNSPPPPPPPEIDVSEELPDIDIPIPDTPVITTLTRILRVIGFGTGLVGIIATGVLLTVVSLVGLVVGVVGTMLVLPGAWESADRWARFNGACEGFWNAMEDMARVYSNPLFDRLPEAQWPSLPYPRLRPPREPIELEYQRQWRAGEEQGREVAFQTMLQLDREPLQRKQLVAGRTLKLRLSGRMILRLLVYSYGREGVAYQVRRVVEERLREQGYAGWPAQP